jgi:hypothetical protein
MWPVVRNVTGTLPEPPPGTLVTGDTCKLLKKDCMLNDARLRKTARSRLKPAACCVAPFNADSPHAYRVHNGSRDASAANISDAQFVTHPLIGTQRSSGAPES